MKKLVDAWYQGSPWLVLLKPLACLFRHQSEKRRQAYQTGRQAAWSAPVPVIIVGNITVGGVGKTPLVAALVNLAREAGFNPGIVSRGYGGKAPHYPFLVTAESDAAQVGDEPLMLARRCGCPVVVDANRVNAVKHLLAHSNCDLVISDDGLQHYALGRDMEIAVIDGVRGLGNGQFLPAGPLREGPERLDEVDWVIVNGGQLMLEQSSQTMQLKPSQLINLSSGEIKASDDLVAEEAHALAGIGNPERFFTTLKKLGYRLQRHAFADHHAFVADDLPANDGKPIIMTEKDAVKCTAIADQRCWYLRVEAELDDNFKTVFQRQLKDLSGLKKMTNASSADN
ncbi:Tetraacyldisaccharide 4'-kinase [gamma proteobacterium IMCC2047]|nr:Tetraacyldisaccharide 4'-kinase [gamma proteobacterium IMCC2047]